MGQRYRCIGIEPHTRADGSATSLATWESECAECGDTFSFETPELASKFNPNRRCEKHRRRGVKVPAVL